jgi:PilZ domain
MAFYDVDRAWDDPFDHQNERRGAARCRVPIRMEISADAPDGKRRGHGPGIVEDISLTGACVATKHELKPGQRIEVTVPTETFREGLCVPDEFEGTAEVTRVRVGEGRVHHVGIRFGGELAESIEFAMFHDQLRHVSGIVTSKGG